MPVLPPPCVKPLDLYRPRDPQASDLSRLMDEHFDAFQQVYDERFAAKCGYWRPVVERSVAAFLKCGELEEGFARVRCPDCKHEMFVATTPTSRGACARRRQRNRPNHPPSHPAETT
ncbi:MAG: transposase zinc-binding domain-containing protein, partial [Planctomycetes bacterium]|nr:transposase zinc-binding domain-containing protein [Planctomycetota bacterium]